MSGRRERAIGSAKVHRTIVRWVAVACAAAACAWGLLHGVDGWPSATSHLRDDAYYEFSWACNLVAGHGPVVSDGVTTSGVQPLWCLLLGCACRGQWLAIADFAVVLGALCHAAAAVSFGVAGRWRPPGLCAALLWLGNPLLVRECQNGQETALACLLAALLWHARRAREPVFLLLSILTVLARSDLWILVLTLSLARRRRQRGPWAGLATPVAALLPHLALNLAIGGGLLPDSALPMAWLAHANFAATAPTLAEHLGQHWWFLRPVLLGHPFAMISSAAIGTLVFLLIRPRWPRSWRAMPLALVGLAALGGVADLAVPAVAAALLLLLPRTAPGPVPPALAAVMLALVGIVFLHWAVRWYPRDYYVAPLAVGAAAAVSRLRSSAWLLCTVPLLQLLQQVAVPLPAEPLRHQRAMQVAGAVLAQVVPAGERVGCFNSGLVAFAQRAAGADAPVVVNLDGVVDHRAFEALQRGELGAFLDAESVRFLADHPVQWSLDPSLQHACGRWFGGGFDPERDLQELVTCVAPGAPAGRPGTESFVLCWRRGNGSPPPLPRQIRQVGHLQDGAPVVLWPGAAGAALELERRDGSRRRVLFAQHGALFAFAVDVGESETGRLFEHGRAEPALVLKLRLR